MLTILTGADEISMREVKRVVRQAERVRKPERCAERAPLIAEVGIKMGFRHFKGC